MNIKVKVIADSVNPNGERITTLIADYPLIIHNEVMTHRLFSRNLASSRAIPVETMISMVMENPFIPIMTVANKGMVSNEVVDDETLDAAKEMYLRARDKAIVYSERMLELGLSKQVVNRLLSPFQYTRALITATEWDNFFNLRCHPDAEPHMQLLAEAIRTAYNESEPKEIGWGEWHIPFDTDKYFVENGIAGMYTQEEKLAIATARAARISYRNEDKDSTIEEDLSIFNRLAKNGHWSPFEHCAKAFDYVAMNKMAIALIQTKNHLSEWALETIDNNYKSQGNFRGFQQLRYFVQNNLPY